MDRGEYNDWNQEEIQKNIVDLNHKSDFQKYCTFSEKVLQAPREYLYTAILKQKQGDKSLFNYLTSSNPSLVYPQALQPKKEEQRKLRHQQLQAGRKLLGHLKSAWSYYFRLIKGSRQQKQSDNYPFSDQNIQNAKNDLQKMLLQLKNSKYYWFNYTIQGIDDMQKQKKEIDEEVTFIELLRNIITNQIIKIKRNQPIDRNKDINQIENAKQRQIEEMPKKRVEVKVKKSIKQTINLKAYFQKRQQILDVQINNNEPQQGNIIKDIQHRRQFNAAALRYYIAQKQQNS